MPSDQTSPEPYTIDQINAAQTRPLRQQVLRPHQRAEELVYPGDEDVETVHLGALSGEGGLVAILSIYRNSAPYPVNARWQIRGMASLPGVQGAGLGRRLLEHARDRVWTTERAPIWCNARESAFGFYEKMGFTRVGEIFEIKPIGPHAVMVLDSQGS